MGAFLSVSQGSAEEPVFMEMSWNNASPDTEPIVLVGKFHFICNFTDFFYYFSISRFNGISSVKIKIILIAQFIFYLSILT